MLATSPAAPRGGAGPCGPAPGFSVVAARCSAAPAGGAAVEALVAAAVADHDRAAVGAAGRVLLDLERGALGAERCREGRRRADLAVAVAVRMAVGVPVPGFDHRQARHGGGG